MYENIEPVVVSNHKNLSVNIDENYGYTSSLDSSPILAAEFFEAAKYYGIVFINNADKVIPIVMLGHKKGMNLYLNDDNSWKVPYIPTYVRRFPFILSESSETNVYTLCIDMDYQGCNTQDKGEKLFDKKGNRSQYLMNKLDFLKEFQDQYKVTQKFTRKLMSLQLLEPMTAEVRMSDGETINLGGFMLVNREKLKQLSAEKIKELLLTEELGLIYTHLYSLQNLRHFPVASKKAFPEEKNKPISKKKKKISKKLTKKASAKKASAKKASAKKASAKKASAKKASAKKSSAKKSSAKKSKAVSLNKVLTKKTGNKKGRKKKKN